MNDSYAADEVSGFTTTDVYTDVPRDQAGNTTAGDASDDSVYIESTAVNKHLSELAIVSKIRGFAQFSTILLAVLAAVQVVFYVSI